MKKSEVRSQNEEKLPASSRQRPAKKNGELALEYGR